MLKKTDRVSRHPRDDYTCRELTRIARFAQARKRHFLRHLYIKCIILPRQARDKHRENSKKVPFSLSGAYDWSEYSLYWGEACVSGTALTRHTSSVLTTSRRPGRKLYELIGHDQLKKTLDDLRTDMESSSGGSGVAVIDGLFREGEDAPLFAVLQTIAGLDHASVDQLLSPHLFSGGNADATGSGTQVNGKGESGKEKRRGKGKGAAGLWSWLREDRSGGFGETPRPPHLSGKRPPP
eukprot:COSAG06_NODE_7824_length_2363_cov_5.710247_2_plen_238_part_00